MWIEKHIVRPYLAFDSVLCEALQHNLPGMVPPPHHPSTAYPLPQVIFRMFDYTDCPEVSCKTIVKFMRIFIPAVLRCNLKTRYIITFLYISYCYSNPDHDRRMVYIIKQQKTSSFSATMINSNDDHISMLEIWHSC